MTSNTGGHCLSRLMCLFGLEEGHPHISKLQIFLETSASTMWLAVRHPLL
jgi:hypothetical protein